MNVSAGSRKLSRTGGDRFIVDDSFDEGIYWREGGVTLPEPIRELQAAYPVQVTADDMPLIWTCWETEDGRLIVFVMNPDQRGPRKNVRITVSGKHDITWFSPEDAGKVLTEDQGAACECRVPHLDIFGFCEVK